MSDALGAEATILSKRPVDLSVLYHFAGIFYTANYSLGIDEVTRDKMLFEAQERVHGAIGRQTLLITSLYALTENGILRDTTLLGEIKTLKPTEFLDAPMDRTCAEVHDGGLAVVVEPADEGDVNHPLLELHGCASLFDELTIPVNGNIILAGQPYFGPIENL